MSQAITLASLHKATQQQIFDFVGTHLLRQGEKSAYNWTEGCAYHHSRPDGKQLACAVGCLITADEYLPAMEGMYVGELAEQYSYPGLKKHRKLLASLQKIHDNKTVESWLSCLESMAKRRNLSVKRIRKAAATCPVPYRRP